MKHVVRALLLNSLTVLLGTMPILCPAQTHNKQAQVHRDKGDKLRNRADYANSLREYKAAYDLDKAKPAYRQDTGTDLRSIGNVHMDQSQYMQALSCYQQALRIAKQTKDIHAQVNTLNNMGLAYTASHQYHTAISYFQQAFPLFQRAKDQDGQASALMNMGNASFHLNQYDNAIDYYRKALPLFPQAKDPEGEASTLNNLGMVSRYLSHYDKALQYFQQALIINRQIKDKNAEANVLNSMGIAYDQLSHYDEAIQYFHQALSIDQQVKNQAGQARDLNNLGLASDDLQQHDTAIQCYQQAFAIFQKINNPDGQASALNNMGIAYDDLGHSDKALPFFEQALPIERQAQDKGGEADALMNLGRVHVHLGQYSTALPYFNQALLVFQQIQDIDGEANDLNNLGATYANLAQYDHALSLFEQVLPIYRQIKDRDGEALDLSALMDAYISQAQPRLAIFYGKQSVNVYQSIRQDIHTMGKAIQKDYLRAKEPTYRKLAEVLIQQGRLPEAEQILGMLKDQEFFDFVQRDPAVTPTAGVASLTPVEDAWQARYQVIADNITAIGQTKQDLLTKQQQADTGQMTLTAPQKSGLQHALAQADADLTVANKAFQGFLTQIATESQNATQATQGRVQTVTDATAFEDTLSQLGPGTVALYTIVEADKARILVVTSQTQVAREYPIKGDELRAKVLAFRQVLQDPTRDPRPLAHELYTILVGPIAKDLQGAQATTLMWSLDDVLRYIPMSALYDGKQYLVERYKNDVFTPASESRLTETPKAQWNGLGLGVSLAHPGFQALAGVPQELDGVIHDPNVTASQTGALPGTILLDTGFTQQAMTQALEEHKYPLVHIASHFDFAPGDETASFLLLGDGSHLSLADIKTLPQVFQGVDLLTLSACDTADGGTGADGREVEGFAVLAQRLGAKAVIASLWPVADASTPLLMETFYRQHSTVPGQPKAEALRQAQLSLLHGTASGTGSVISRAEIVPDKKKATVDTLPFMPDPKAPFAHPYYWAPFILIGNWK